MVYEKEDNLVDYEFYKLNNKIEELKKIRSYDEKLNLLKNKNSLEDNNRKEFELIDKMNEVAETLWKLWLKFSLKQLLPKTKKSYQVPRFT